jgi:putative intracellular protease/amidase
MAVEVSVPYAAMKEAGFDIKFATEQGKPPVGDKLMLEGITQRLLVSGHGWQTVTS